MRIRTSAKTVLIEYRDHGLLYRKDGDLEVLLETDPITSQMNHSRITMYAIRLFPFLILTCLVYYVTSAPARGKSTGMIKPYAAAPRQDIVTWDEHSIMVRGERILLYSGEFHPFRLPVPSLWLDIFQKIKAAGFSGVSFYADWALLEGKEGKFAAEGIFAFEPFFDAASEAGIYLVARPGPYINAEVSGGGYPGWLQRVKAIMRTPDYLPLTENYIKNIGAIIAKAQITNGGPIILVQPENEYSQATPNILFPDHQYFAAIEKQLRDAGIVVPFVSNDAAPHGYFAPGTGVGAVDIYGHDAYPLGFDCSKPTTWPNGSFPTDLLSLHLLQSPSTPYTISEFQGGSFDPWGGSYFSRCYQLTNERFERVFYKSLYAIDIAIFNIYMIYGGTNWGNLGHPGGYTSYDYAAAIAEDRTVAREKYSEVKLQANFLRASPAYLTAVYDQTANRSYVNAATIATTRLAGNTTGFYVVRHAMYNTLASTNYTLTVPTSQGNITVPQFSPTLTLNGRDSKIHVTDYDVGGVNMLYSSAEVFAWKRYEDRIVLLLYGDVDENHEVAFVGQKKYELLEGSGVKVTLQENVIYLNWAVTSDRKILRLAGSFYVYLLSRNDAYNYWILDLPGTSSVYNFSTPSTTSIIARAGYLLRTASLNGSTLALTGDINATTTIEVIGAPFHHNKPRLAFNSNPIPCTEDTNGIISGTVEYISPTFHLPNLSILTWKFIDSLPELLPTYDDRLWPYANHTTSNNTVFPLLTPVSLFGSDYGFHTGTLLFRGHFLATGTEKTFDLRTQGGTAYGVSIYLNSTFLAAFPGLSTFSEQNQTLTLPSLVVDRPYVLNIVLDTMGLDEDFKVGTDTNKNPRGILSYMLSSHDPAAVSWKLTGNLGGEDFADYSRGPLNEGGLYAERLGFHLPSPPSESWETRSPLTGIASPGVGFFTTSFVLDLPLGYDIPLSFIFTNTTSSSLSSSSSSSSPFPTSPPAKYRAQLYVNGFQFGKYINHIGPQTAFPVPEGILNHRGLNFLAVSLWGSDVGGNMMGGLELRESAKVMWGFEVRGVQGSEWTRRAGAY